MKKLMFILIPLLIACSFQVRESEDYEERLSRRPTDESQGIYSEFRAEDGFRPYYEEKVPLVDYQVEDRERMSRRLDLIFFDEENLIERDIYDPYNIYQDDPLNYEIEDEIEVEFIQGEEEGILKLKHF